MTFRDLGLSAPILKALEQQGYQKPSPIQCHAIPPALKGKDVLGCAQTGTGKTCAFATPILQRLSQRRGAGRPIRALILTPTRELAIQIGESFQAYGANLKLRCAVIFGGVGQNPQVEQLKRGVDILVATPGRLGDLYQQKLIDLSALEIFVLDEADRMLDMGFIHDVRKILKWLPEKKQTLFFSATMPPEITDLVNSLLHDPVKVEVDPVSSPVEAIEQEIYFVDKGNKTKLLAHLVKKLKMKNALVFTRTKHGANKVARDLEKMGITAAAIHGNKSQTARQQALADFKAGKVQCLVATDIAARGLDIEELSHVFNYNLTEVPETYVHRIGRTGRAGREGVVISLCDFAEKELLKGIERLIGRKLPIQEEHPYPMTVFEAPRRDKNGKIINEEDEKAREAARERRREQLEQRKKVEKVPEKAPVSAPAAEEAAQPKKKRRKKKSAVTAETVEPIEVQKTSEPEYEPPYQVKTRRPQLTRSGVLMDTGDAMPNTEFYRPNPLDSDVIMDATARLLAPRRTLSFGKNAYDKPEMKREERGHTRGKRSVEAAMPHKEKQQAEKPVKQEKTPLKSLKASSRHKNKKTPERPAVSEKIAAPVLKWEDKPKKQPPQEQKRQEKVAPEKKGQKRRNHKSRTPNLDGKKPQLKDSTQQPSLMKPFYLDFGG